jgi:CRISPR/Cas system CSM-associated protein Csm3 (group 7 of RAMP superfamily)
MHDADMRPTRRVARATIQFTTPFHVGAGREGEFSDADIVTDVNGLPALPGTSIAGALRNAFASACGDTGRVKRVFGFQDLRRHGARETADGRGSALSVSWACIHDATDTPVEGIVDRDRIDRDPVLSTAMWPAMRDHVRIGSRGAADARNVNRQTGDQQDSKGGGKFDELAVPAGHRFTFELELAGKIGNSAEDAEDWKLLLQCLRSLDLRIGGKSRRGYGAFEIHSLRERAFNLGEAADYAAYLKNPVSLAVPARELYDWQKDREPEKGRAIHADIEIEFEDYWMIGGGVDETDSADMAPFRDTRVQWDQVADENGRYGRAVSGVLVVPGSSVKGAISHRVAYHHNRLAELFAEDGNGHVGERNPAVFRLFGKMKADSHGDTNDSPDEAAEALPGRRGIAWFDDVYLPADCQDEFEAKQQVINHVALDHFTGGARAGLLFNEKPLHGGALALRLFVLDPTGEVDPLVRQALRETLADLAEGRLQLGAGSGRGEGYAKKATITWSDKGAWIGAANEGVGKP